MNIEFRIVINGKDNRWRGAIFRALTSEQEAIYIHIIDYVKHHDRKRIYRGNEYDAILPDVDFPRNAVQPIIPLLDKMQQGKFVYKPHKLAFCRKLLDCLHQSFSCRYSFLKMQTAYCL